MDSHDPPSFPSASNPHVIQGRVGNEEEVVDPHHPLRPLFAAQGGAGTDQ